MDWSVISALLRHGLTTLAGIAVAKGYVDADAATQLVGAAVAIAGVGWSIYEKKSRPAQ